MTTEKTKEETLQDIGRNALASLREMVAALECDYDRKEVLEAEMEDACTGQSSSNVWDDEWLAATADDDQHTIQEGAKELIELREAAGECSDRDDAEQRIHEDALSVEFRSGWVTDKSDMKAEEAMILLCTGGPAVRIMVELDDGEPHRAYLQVQDWFTPWTDYYEEGIGEVLMAYASCFCFAD